MLGAVILIGLPAVLVAVEIGVTGRHACDIR
jgi:hypothetical protein